MCLEKVIMCIALMCDDIRLAENNRNWLVSLYDKSIK